MEVQFSEGHFEIKLTNKASDIDAAQKLRYLIFYEETFQGIPIYSEK